MDKKKTQIEIPECTDENIKKTREMVKLQYGVALPKKDTPHFIELVYQLQWWVENEPEDHHGALTDDMVDDYKKLFKEKYGKDLETPEARKQLAAVVVFSAYKEKVRLTDEMRAIIVKHKKVDYNPVLLEKLSKLFDMYYRFTPTEVELKRVLRYLSKYIWQNEGLDKDVEKIFDDMIKYKGKLDRGKSLAGIDNHKTIKDQLDNIIEKSK